MHRSLLSFCTVADVAYIDGLANAGRRFVTDATGNFIGPETLSPKTFESLRGLLGDARVDWRSTKAFSADVVLLRRFAGGHHRLP